MTTGNKHDPKVKMQQALRFKLKQENLNKYTKVNNLSASST